MNLTKAQLRKIILEAIDPIKVKTVAPEDYDPPAAFANISQGIRTEENPKKIVGNFFMTVLPFKPPRGYSSLKKLRYFYMILPDGEGISIGSMPVSDKEGLEYLNVLNQTVVPLEIENHLFPTENDKNNIRMMQQQVLSAQEQFNRGR
jgi:hypothetical protein